MCICNLHGNVSFIVVTVMNVHNLCKINLSKFVTTLIFPLQPAAPRQIWKNTEVGPTSLKSSVWLGGTSAPIIFLEV